MKIGLAATTLSLALLAGCAGKAPVVPQVAVPAYATESAVRDASSALDASEPIPTATELAALAIASPDKLVADAPPEPGWPNPPAGDLANFGQVEDTLFRGARPTDKGLERLQAMGVKTIVNFENDQAAVAHEQAWCQAHGLRFESIALSVITPPKQEKVDQWLKLAEDASLRPLYFHCMQGRDRTGTAGLTYRIHHDRWAFDAAYAEMRQYHFHTYLLGLQYYIRHYAASQHAG